MTSTNPPEAAALDVRRPDSAESKAGAKRTVLCVDDEPAILSALKRALRAPDIAVLTATSGAQALEIMAELPVDLVISDMRMPGMDGAQLLERACSEWPDAVRILLTGHADTAATIQAVNRGRIFRYLQKPWDERELVESVREGLELRQRRRDEARLLDMGAVQEQQLRQLNEELRQLQEQHAAERRSSDAARQRRYLQSVKVLTNLLEVRCSALFGHGRRVATLARDLAKSMGLSSEATLTSSWRDCCTMSASSGCRTSSSLAWMAAAVPMATPSTATILRCRRERWRRWRTCCQSPGSSRRTTNASTAPDFHSAPRETPFRWGRGSLDWPTWSTT